MSDALPILSEVIPTASGVHLLPQALVFDHELEWSDYRALWTALAEFHVISQEHLPFWLGDLLNEVELRRGDTYVQLVDVLPVVSIETLRQYKWVCGRVPPQMRQRVQGPEGGLTYTLCRAVAAVEQPARREMALGLALRDGWSSRELRDWLLEQDMVPYSPPPRELPTATMPAPEPQEPQQVPPEAVVERAVTLAPDWLATLEQRLLAAWDALGAEDIYTAAQALDTALALVRERMVRYG